jgi:hypothetical protein
MAKSPPDISGLGLDELKALVVQVLEENTSNSHFGFAS